MINLTNSKVQEYRTAPVVGDALDNTFVLKRVDDGNGNSAVAKATGAANEDIVGLAHVPPIASTSRSVVNEEHSHVDNKVTLNHSSVISGSLRVYNKTKDASINLSNHAVSGNVITFAPAAGDYPEATDELLISYRRSVTLAELGREGLPLDFSNQVTGSDGAVEFASGKSTVEVDFFDTTVAYSVGQALYANSDAILTSTSSGPKVGTVSKVPTADDPVLGVAGEWKF